MAAGGASRGRGGKKAARGGKKAARGGKKAARGGKKAARGRRDVWATLQHGGVLFPPEYEPKGLAITVRGERVPLDPLQEEMAYQWAKKKDTPYARDAVFRSNFASDFIAALPPRLRGARYGEIDFAEAYRTVDAEKAAKEALTKEERKALAAERKAKREGLKARYGIAVLDGAEVDVGNYMVEPPGIFIGRGEHPLRGRWKARISPRDVTLNLGGEAAPPPGEWGRIVRDRTSTWLAKWTDGLTKRPKYVWLADTAGVKQEMDRAKYDKATALSKSIRLVEAQMVRDMRASNRGKRRTATACYLIYRTAMRVGDEKDPDEADTVGATTLRKEHVKFGDGGIEFDFLGKDSVRWQETVKPEGHDVQFIANLKELADARDDPRAEIFGRMTSRTVNAYYSGIVDGLSAKVFRTYLASRVVAAYLREHADAKGGSEAAKVYHARMANLRAAVKCNHKRTIPRTFERSLERKREALAAARAKESKTDKQATRKAERIEKMSLQLDLAERTRDYNMGTSLRNYIDPRLFKAWMAEVEGPWEKLYTAALQRKFLWAKDETRSWRTVSKLY